jgi:hypothetical protein
MRATLFAWVVVSFIFAAPLRAQPPSTSKPVSPTTLPFGLGVNIHFTKPRPGEMEMLTAGGFTFVRMDFDWMRTEKSRGKYDWSDYEMLLKALEPHGIRALFILDYVNPLYDDSQSPHGEEARQAFARWAAAAAKHFQGRGVLWEMYNEPNITPFWRPAPNTEDYIKLALEVGKAIRAAAPDEAYIGPACSTMDFPFLEACFRAGLLEYFSAVSVHPYRQQPPETVQADYRKLRQLIAQHAPQGKQVPIYSGEWGYSSAWSAFDDAKQGSMLARQWLTNIACDVPLSIWYDWHDDGPDPKEPEHHFGTVRTDYHEGRAAVYDTKPAYLAAETLTNQLRGYRFNKRLALEHPDDHVLIFEKAVDAFEMVDHEKYRNLVLAVWTSSDTSHEVTLPASPGRFRVTSHTGEARPELTADAAGLRITLTQSPQYLVPAEPNDLLRLAAAWSRLKSEFVSRRGDTATPSLTLNNPLDRAFRQFTPSHKLESTVEPHQGLGVSWNVPNTLSEKPIAFRAEIEIRRLEGSRPARLAQETWIISATPLRVIPFAPRDGGQWIRVENPSSTPFDGKIRVAGAPQSALKLRFDEGQSQSDLMLALPRGEETGGALEIVDNNNDVGLVIPPRRMKLIPLDPAALKLIPDGDKKVSSQQRFEVTDDVSGLPVPGISSLRIHYNFDAG